MNHSGLIVMNHDAPRKHLEKMGFQATEMAQKNGILNW